MKLAAADLANCADEPIRVPGAIQPHGLLAVLDADSGELLAYSANWASPESARAAADAVPLHAGDLREGEAPSALGVVKADGRELHASAHRLAGRIVIEFEPALTEALTQAPIYSLARRFPGAMQRSATQIASADAVTACAARGVRSCGAACQALASVAARATSTRGS